MAQFFKPPPLNTLTSAPIAPPPVSSSPPEEAAASAAASIAACKTVELTPGRGMAAPTLTITIIMIHSVHCLRKCYLRKSMAETSENQQKKKLSKTLVNLGEIKGWADDRDFSWPADWV